MKETWTDWIINRTTLPQRIAVELAIGSVLVAFAIFMT